jgi:hypothetical protein
MQAILHLGDMKCGSTSIQEWMTRDAELLRENGFWLSTVTRVVNYDSRLSCYALDNRAMETEPRREAGIRAATEVPAFRRDMERRLADEMAAAPSSARAMLFSHEMLLMLKEHEVQRLVAMLGPMFDGIRVVAYIRRQDRLFLSLWGQRLKRYHPGPAFCDHLIKQRSYLRMLDSWQRAVGHDNLTVRVFDKASFAHGDLQADFRDAAGIPPDERYSKPIRTNESLDATAQTLLLELGARLATREDADRRRLVFLVRRLLDRRKYRHPRPASIPAHLKNHLLQHFTGRGLMPGRGWAEQVMAGFAKENEEIRRRFFPERAQLFDDDFSDYAPEGGPPGAGLRAFDPDAVREPVLGPLEPEAVAEAYSLVLGRKPRAADIDRERGAAANIAHLYASLLNRRAA